MPAPSTAPITVAVPTWRGVRHLPEALRTIQSQTDVDFELLVVDDRSDDRTAEVARELVGDRGRVVINSERLGLAGNWDRCMRLAGSPLVSIFHQDDVMRPGHLAAIGRAIAADDRLGMAFTAADVIDEAGRAVPESVVGRGDLGPSDRVFQPGEFAAELAASNPVRCSGVLLRKAAYLAVGGFDPAYCYALDWEFWARVARTWGVAWVARPGVAIRWHPGSETQRFARGIADLDEVARVIAQIQALDRDRLVNLSEYRRRSDRLLKDAYRRRALAAIRGGNLQVAARALGRSIRRPPGPRPQCVPDR